MVMFFLLREHYTIPMVFIYITCIRTHLHMVIDVFQYLYTQRMPLVFFIITGIKRFAQSYILGYENLNNAVSKLLTSLEWITK